MATENEGQEKTEQPTPKKLEEGRKQGQVAKSMEINSWVVFTTGLLMIFITKEFIGNRMSELAISIFRSLDMLELNVNMVQNYALGGYTFFVITIAPVLGLLLIAAFLASASQVGVKFSSKALAPKFSKLNPITGIKNVFFTSRSLLELVKSLTKLVVIGLFTYYVISDMILTSTRLVGITVSEILGYMLDAAYSLLWKVSLVYALLAVIDFIFQKYKFKKEMMMTKQEVKEENKQSEGDPLVKQRIRKEQYTRARSRMMADVPKADVIITNPTHYAIALKYDMSKNSAPKVLAKGIDLVAQKIKKIAAENNIPMHEDRELARALYKTCEIGDEIPPALFKAVAQILAYIFKLRNERKKKSII